MATLDVTALRGTSPDKLEQVTQLVATMEPDSAEVAVMQTVFLGLAPQLRMLLPADPVELDDFLLAGAHWLLALRGDDAPARVIAAPDRALELVAGDEEPLA